MFLLLWWYNHIVGIWRNITLFLCWMVSRNYRKWLVYRGYWIYQQYALSGSRLLCYSHRRKRLHQRFSNQPHFISNSYFNKRNYNWCRLSRQWKWRYWCYVLWRNRSFIPLMDHYYSGFRTDPQYRRSNYALWRCVPIISYRRQRMCRFCAIYHRWARYHCLQWRSYRYLLLRPNWWSY